MDMTIMAEQEEIFVVIEQFGILIAVVVIGMYKVVKMALNSTHIWYLVLFLILCYIVI